MLVTHSGPQLPSALCIQHGAVAPRGREERRREEREGARVWERKREGGSQTARDQSMLRACDKAPPTVTHTHCTHKRQMNNLNSSTYSKFPGSVFVCLYEQERESKWASLCDRQQRDSVTLYITSLSYTDTHVLVRGGGAVWLTADSAAPPPSVSRLLIPLAHVPSLFLFLSFIFLSRPLINTFAQQRTHVLQVTHLQIKPHEAGLMNAHSTSIWPTYR